MVIPGTTGMAVDRVEFFINFLFVKAIFA